MCSLLIALSLPLPSILFLFFLSFYHFLSNTIARRLARSFSFLASLHLLPCLSHLSFFTHHPLFLSLLLCLTVFAKLLFLTRLAKRVKTRPGGFLPWTPPLFMGQGNQARRLNESSSVTTAFSISPIMQSSLRRSCRIDTKRRREENDTIDVGCLSIYVYLNHHQGQEENTRKTKLP